MCQFTLEHSRFHQLESPAQSLSRPRHGAPGYSAAHGGCEDAPWPDQANAEGAWGTGNQRPRGSQPLGTGPSLPARPPRTLPPTLFPARPVPSDASNVTADNLDFNQEITHPLPAPLTGSGRRKPRPEPPESCWRQAPRPPPPVSQLPSIPSHLQRCQGCGVRGSQALAEPCPAPVGPSSWSQCRRGW